MSMKMFNVYRSIHSSELDDQPTLQKIAQIAAEDYRVAYKRATFIKGFFTWDNQSGSVIDSEDTQPIHETASSIPSIQASHYCNDCLERQHQLIKQELEQHNRRMTMLSETFESMLATM